MKDFLMYFLYGIKCVIKIDIIIFILCLIIFIACVIVSRIKNIIKHKK